MASSKYLGTLDAEARSKLEQRLLSRQSGRCFICDDPIDLVLHKGQLDVDHIDPLAAEGLDAENNFALTHQSCNRSKGAANLQVARRIKEFERLQEQAKDEGKRGANLGDVLAQHGGAKAPLRLRTKGDVVEFSLPEAGDNAIRAVPMLEDKLSGMRSFFAVFPLSTCTTTTALTHAASVRTSGDSLRSFCRSGRNSTSPWRGGRRRATGREC